MPFHSTTIFTLTHLLPLSPAHLPQQKTPFKVVILYNKSIADAHPSFLLEEAILYLVRSHFLCGPLTMAGCFISALGNWLWCHQQNLSRMSKTSRIARFIGPTWGPSGADRSQVGRRWAPWTLLSGMELLCEDRPVDRHLWAYHLV